MCKLIPQSVLCVILQFTIYNTYMEMVSLLQICIYTHNTVIVISEMPLFYKKAHDVCPRTVSSVTKLPHVHCVRHGCTLN